MASTKKLDSELPCRLQVFPRHQGHQTKMMCEKLKSMHAQLTCSFKAKIDEIEAEEKGGWRRLSLLITNHK